QELCALSRLVARIAHRRPFAACQPSARNETLSTWRNASLQRSGLDASRLQHAELSVRMGKEVVLMAKTFDAVYEKGVFKPLGPIDLEEGQRVQVTLPDEPKLTAEESLELLREVQESFAEFRAWFKPGWRRAVGQDSDPDVGSCQDRNPDLRL